MSKARPSKKKPLTEAKLKQSRRQHIRDQQAQQERQHEARRAIQEHQERTNYREPGPLYTAIDDDSADDEKFEHYLLRSNLGKTDPDRPLSPGELSLVLETWPVDDLQILWARRETKLRSQYDCARVLAQIRNHMGIDQIARNPNDLMGVETIRSLSASHPSGLEGKTTRARSTDLTAESYKRIARVRQTVREDQAGFRERLIAHYGLRCMATGVTVSTAIEAAHIAPYEGRATNTPENGLLLRTDIHRMFDAGLVAVNPDTLQLKFAASVADTVYRKLGGQALILGGPRRISHTALSVRWSVFSQA